MTDIIIAVVGLMSLVGVVLRLRHELSPSFGREALHEHSDIADKYRCDVCNPPNELGLLPSLEAQVDWSKFSGSMVDLVIRESDEAVKTAEELHALPGLIDQHLLPVTSASWVRPIAENRVRTFGGKQYVALRHRGNLEWVDAEFALKHGLITQYALDKDPAKARAVAGQVTMNAADWQADISADLQSEIDHLRYEMAALKRETIRSVIRC